MTPFEKFFAGPFQSELERATVPGMPDASWDRKAAWLLWVSLTDQDTAEAMERTKPTKPKDMDDLL